MAKSSKKKKKNRPERARPKSIKRIKSKELKKKKNLTITDVILIELKAENKKLEVFKEEAIARNWQESRQYIRGKIDRGVQLIEQITKLVKKGK